MKPTHTLLILTWISLLLLSLAACSPPPVEESYFQAESGELDLKEWEVVDGQLLPLAGEWAFYWEQLLAPDEVENSIVNGRKKNGSKI